MVLYRKRGLLGRDWAASRARALSTGAFTLVELIVATTVIGLVAGSSIYALLDANRFAATQRVRTAAKAACQERIDQALTTPYSPPDALPALFTTAGSIPAPNGNPDRGTQTVDSLSPAGQLLKSSEPISLYFAQDDEQKDQSHAQVQATRTTRVSLSDATLGLVRVWVRVDYTFRGKTYAYEMYVVRAPD